MTVKIIPEIRKQSIGRKRPSFIKVMEVGQGSLSEREVEHLHSKGLGRPLDKRVNM